jgi:hypothetical protein
MAFTSWLLHSRVPCARMILARMAALSTFQVSGIGVGVFDLRGNSDMARQLLDGEARPSEPRRQPSRRSLRLAGPPWRLVAGAIDLPRAWGRSGRSVRLTSTGRRLPFDATDPERTAYSCPCDRCERFTCMVRSATISDIPRLIEIRGSVRENRLSDPNRVTIAVYEWHIIHGPIHIWEGNGVIA